MTPQEQKQQSRAAGLWYLLQILFGVVLCGIGGALLGTSLAQLQDMAGATFANCNLVNFQAEAMRSVVFVEPACKSECTFQVRALFYDGREAFTVKDFLPAVRSSYTSATGIEWVHPQFSCCPKTTAECCGFRDEQRKRFCDNWGSFDDQCHQGGWRCYVKDLENVVDERGWVPAELLSVGDAKQSYQNVIVGSGLLFLGLIALACLRPKLWCYPCLRCWHSMPTRAKIVRKLAFALPKFLRTEKMQRMVEESAAMKIQRMVRGVNARVLFKELLRSEEGQKPASPARMWNREMVYGPFLRDAASMHTRLEQGLLYDTGSASTFRRVVHSRVVSAPGDQFERVEVSLNKQATWLEGAFKVRQGDPPMLAQSPPKAFAEVYGVRQGHSLLGVGKLKWPDANARQLLQALCAAPRPVILLFEGMPEDKELPHRPENLAGSLVPPALWRNPPARKKARVRPESLEPSPLGCPLSGSAEREAARARAESLEPLTPSPKGARTPKKDPGSPLKKGSGFLDGLRVLVPGFDSLDCEKGSVCSSPTGTVCGSPFRRGRRTPMASKDLAGRRALSMGHSPTGRRRRRVEEGTVSPMGTSRMSGCLSPTSRLRIERVTTSR